jgi:N-acyl-D-amino-acid deacylase
MKPHPQDNKSKSASFERSLTRREFLALSGTTGILFVANGCASGSPAVRARAPFDCVIKGGSVLDGTGAPEKVLDVGIRDGRILALGQLDHANAERVINAGGLKVCPGFIDVHSHVDIDLFADPRAESKVHQGVTTEASGMDGDSAAPLGGPTMEDDLARFKERFGFDCPYRDLGGYFDLLEKKKTAQNIVTFVGLGTIRGKIVGQDNRPPTDGELKAMQNEVRLGIEQGCRGVSTGLEYTPGSYASTEELWLLTKEAPQKYRVYATHMRNEADQGLEAIAEAITIARNSGARLQVSHLKAQNRRNWPNGAKALEMLEKAIESGVDVHADRYPYIAFSTGLDSLFPLWCREGGTTKFLARLRDNGLIGRIREEVQKKVDGLSSWDAVMITSVALDEDRRLQGKTLQQIAADEHADPFDFTVDLLQKELARVEMVGFGMDEPGTELILSWKNTMICSDAGAYSPSRSTSRPHPRAYGSFPRAIAWYEKRRRIVGLPEMIRKMTSLPAQVLGLTDRGTIAVGNRADIVLFDYEKIGDRATYVDPHQFPSGIPTVLVNGIPVIEQGEQTKNLPGTVLRSV